MGSLTSVLISYQKNVLQRYLKYQFSKIETLFSKYFPCNTCDMKNPNFHFSECDLDYIVLK